MNRWIIFFLFCFFTLRANAACIVHLFPRIITGFSSGSEHRSIKKTNCDTNTVKYLNSFFTSNSGKFTTRQLSANINNSGATQEIELLPHQIEVVKISDILRNHFALNESIYLSHVTNTENLASIGVDEFDFDNAGNIDSGIVKISYNGQHVTWLRFNVQVKTSVVTALKSISRGDLLLENENVATQEEFLPKSEIYMNRVEPYTIATKQINAGERVKREYFRKETIVAAQNPVGVILKTGEIKLTTRGISLQSGHYGQTIPVKLENTKKIVNGNIIAPNKVVVDL